MGEPTPKAEIVPFGKYKGQPVEVLLADDGYRDWLMSQDWFRARFGNIYQTIINYGAEPQDTPEHNEMQAAFLDDERCFQLARVLWPHHAFDRTGISRSGAWHQAGAALYKRFAQYLEAEYETPSIVGRKFEAAGWDVIYRVAPTALLLEVKALPECTCRECTHAADCPGRAPCRGGDGEQYSCRHAGHERRRIPTLTTTTWTWHESSRHCAESCPWAAEKMAEWLLGSAEEQRWYQPNMPGTIRIECKPDLGDDFPTVLRQVMRYEHDSRDARCVIARRASFEKVTWEQVAAMFAASGMTLLREEQLLDDGPGGQ